MGLIYTSVSSRKARLKKKATKAEQEAENSFKLFNEKWDALPKFAGKYGATKARKKPVVLAEAAVITVRPRTGKFDQGSTALPEQKTYTGVKVLGVATMHKSNAVPVFSEEEALEVATMRRN